MFNTRIFARQDVLADMQALVYEMRVSAEEECAMVLPLPVHPTRRELTFANLEDYEEFFDDLERCFPKPRAVQTRSAVVASADTDLLEVHRVGSFDASFVPTQSDFARLDPRFQMPPGTWDKLGDYADYGFAVFKLRAGEQQSVHPMAFRFVSRDSTRLFFPTVHVHNGTVSSWADFNHVLYAQTPDVESKQWVRGGLSPAKCMKLSSILSGDRTKGLVLPEEAVWKRAVLGKYRNLDTWLERT